MKLLEENTGENFCDLGLGKEFFDRTSKARSSLRAWNWGTPGARDPLGKPGVLKRRLSLGQQRCESSPVWNILSVLWANSVGIGSPLWCRETRLRSVPGPWHCNQEQREKGRVSREAVGRCSVLCLELPQCLSQRFSGSLSR